MTAQMLGILTILLSAAIISAGYAIRWLFQADERRRRRNRLKYQNPISATVARAFCKAMSEQNKETIR